ncbi:27261_t:CDS:2, partial [Racocetra persica]
LTLERTNELRKSRVECTTYSYDCIEKAKLNIDRTNVELDNDFIEDVKSALDDTYSHRKKINKLKDISRKYGHFYASEVVFGGAIIKNIKSINEQENATKGRNSKMSFGFKNNQANVGLENNSENTVSKLLNISQKTLTIIGGNVALYIQDDKEAEKNWRNSVNDSKHWRIISYNIRPIFDLLNDEIKNKVLEAFGKQILKGKPFFKKLNRAASFIETGSELTATITIRDTELQQLSSCPIVIDDLNKEIKDVTSSPHQCQIFASIINQDNRVYSLRVEYLDENTPVFVIHYIENFIFEQRNNEMEVIINEKYCEEMIKVEIENNHSYSCSINSSSNSCCKLGISVIESPEISSNYNVYRSKIVTGAHFSPENMACLFIHNLDKKHNINENVGEDLRLKMVYGIIDVRDAKSLLLKVKWKNYKSSMVPNCFDDYKKLIAHDEDKKILSLILKSCCELKDGYKVGDLVFMNVVNKCDHHGFVNITPQYLLYDSLNNTSNEFEGHISSHEIAKHKMNHIVPHHQYFSVLPEEILNHFRAVFLQDINNKLGFHRTNEGVNHFQWNFPESLFYYFFSNEIGFCYRPSIRRYTCIFNGQDGYKRIGNIMQCEFWEKGKIKWELKPLC